MTIKAGQQLLHYRLVAKIGEGGMGEVYRATDTKLRRDVALKVLPPDMAGDIARLARFEREARAIAALNHPNIVTIYSVEHAEGVRFLTMELVAGRSLDRLIPEDGMPVERLLAVGGAVAEALAVAHAKGIVHRDLKPANVMVSEEGRVKVLDFGLAKETRPADPAARTVTAAGETAMGVVLGTPAYMSPEQATGCTIDHRTDIFSLGILLYEMASGRRPFEGRSAAELVSSILRDTPRRLDELRAGLPAAFTAMVEQCLAKEVDDRPASAREIHDMLAALRANPASIASEATRSKKGASNAPLAPALGEPRKRTADHGFWVAVMPFRFRGADRALEALAEDFTEEIVTGLSRFSYLRVVGHGSMRRYANQAVDVRTVGTELGARYVLEGSVRRAGTAVRIAVRLVETDSGSNLWAETYDRPFDPDQSFELIDDVVPRIVSTSADMHGVLPHTMSEALRSRELDDLSPYEAVLRSFGYVERLTAEEHLQVRTLMERTAAKVPTNTDALAMLSFVYAEEFKHGFNLQPGALDRALEAARSAVAAGPSNNLAYHVLAQALFFRRELPAFRNAARRAVDLNPMDGGTIAFMGILLGYAGDWEHGPALAARAMKLNPNHPGWYHFGAFFDAYRKRDYRTALDVALRINLPSYFHYHGALAMAAGQLGNLDVARQALGELLSQKPDFVETATAEWSKWLGHGELLDHALDGLRKAGLSIPDRAGDGK